MYTKRRDLQFSSCESLSERKFSVWLDFFEMTIVEYRHKYCLLLRPTRNKCFSWSCSKVTLSIIGDLRTIEKNPGLFNHILKF